MQANSVIQLILPVRVHHWVHLVSPSHRRTLECIGPTNDYTNPSLSRPDRLVSCCRSQYTRWLGRPSQSRGYRCLPIARLLHFNWLPLLYQLDGCLSCCHIMYRSLGEIHLLSYGVHWAMTFVWTCYWLYLHICILSLFYLCVM